MAGCIYTIDGQKFTEENAKKYIADNFDNFKSELGISDVSKQASGITHAATAIRRRELGMEDYESDHLSIFEANSEAEAILNSGNYNVNDLLNKAAKTNDASPVEIEIMKITMATLDAEIAKNPTADLVNKQMRLIRVSDAIGSETGRKLAFRRGMTEPMSTISEFYVDKMDKNGVTEFDHLTDLQKEEAKADFEKMQAHEEKVNEEKAKIDKFQADIEETKKAAEKNFKSEKDKPKKEKRDYAAEKKSIIDGIRDKWKKAGKSDGNVLTSVALPFSKQAGTKAKQLIEVSPDVAKLMRIYIDEGVDKLSDVVDKIHDDLGLPLGIDRKDIYDIIAGKYAKPKPTKSELQRKVDNLKLEAKLLSRIEEVKNGTPRTEKEKRQSNVIIGALQKQLYDLKRATPGYYDVSRLNTATEKVKSDTEKILADIANNNFAEKPKVLTIINDRELRKRNPKLYNDYIDAIEAKDKAKHEYNLKMAEEQLRTLDWKLRTLTNVGNLSKETLNTIKAIKAGIDNSAVFVQCGLAVMNPLNIKATVKALASQPMQAFSESSFKRRIIEVHQNKELMDLIKLTGLDYLDPRGYAESTREESFGGRNLLERVKLDKLGKIGEGRNLAQLTTAPFERLFTGFTNEFRLQLLIKGTNQLMSEGRTPENSPKDYESLGSYINNMTGRGKSFKPIQGQVENAISGVIWAPKLLSSTLNTLGIGDITVNAPGIFLKNAPKGYYKAMTPRMRRYAIVNTAAGIASGITVMALYALQDDKKVDYDPESVTFGQIIDTKTGWTSNPFGRITPVIRYIAMMIMGAKKYNEKNIPFNYGKESYKFSRAKFQPVAGILTDAFITHTDFYGRPYDITKVTASDVIEPMFINDMRKQMEIDGTQALFNAIPTFYGMKISNQKMFDKRDLPSLLEDIQQSNSIDKNFIYNYKEGGRKITNTEFKEYATKRDAMLKDFVEKIYKEGVPIVDEKGKAVIKNIADLKKDELKSTMEKLKSIATSELKKNLFGEKPQIDPDEKSQLNYMWEELGISRTKDEED